METYACYRSCGSSEDCGCNGNCNCGESEFSGRRFLTKEEKIQKLKKYQEALNTESKAVSEKIAELEED